MKRRLFFRSLVGAVAVVAINMRLAPVSPVIEASPVIDVELLYKGPLYISNSKTSSHPKDFWPGPPGSL